MFFCTSYFKAKKKKPTKELEDKQVIPRLLNLDILDHRTDYLDYGHHNVQ